MIKLKILSENRDNGLFIGEAGLSVWIEAFGQQFLLDIGYSDLFLKNAQLLNLDLNKINTVVLTHGHSDHTNGVPYLNGGKTIILHPAAFKDRWSIRRRIYLGMPIKQEGLEKQHKVVVTKQPLEFCENCYFLGEIPMVIDFEAKGNFASTLDENLTQTDYTEDDSGIAITTEQGLFILTGCGHRGVCNTIEHAKKVTGQNQIYAVFGGFHLRNLEKHKDVINQTISYLKANNVKELYLGHCVADDVISYFEQNLREVKIVRLAAGKEFDVQLLPPTKTNN